MTSILRKKEGFTLRMMTALLIAAAGVALPQVFHIFGGAEISRTFLPMHFAVILGGGVLTAEFGLFAGLLCPLLSYLLTGMPSSDKLVYMMAELGLYGALGGLLTQKGAPAFAAIAGAMVFGRLAMIGFYAAAQMFGAAGVTWLTPYNALIAGLPGVLLQLATLPALAIALRRVRQ